MIVYKMIKQTLPINNSCIDVQYGRYDVAPRVMDHLTGKTGYLVAYDLDSNPIIVWDPDDETLAGEPDTGEKETVLSIIG